mgnify:CR=1 FL=1
MMRFLKHYNYKFVVVMTKSDKLNKSETEKRLKLIKKELNFLETTPEIIPVSSVHGNGIEQLKQIIEECVENGNDE